MAGERRQEQSAIYAERMKIQDLRNPIRRQGEIPPFGWRMGYANMTYAGKGSF